MPTGRAPWTRSFAEREEAQGTSRTGHRRGVTKTMERPPRGDRSVPHWSASGNDETPTKGCARSRAAGLGCRTISELQAVVESHCVGADIVRRHDDCKGQRVLSQLLLVVA